MSKLEDARKQVDAFELDRDDLEARLTEALRKEGLSGEVSAVLAHYELLPMRGTTALMEFPKEQAGKKPRAEIDLAPVAKQMAKEFNNPPEYFGKTESLEKAKAILEKEGLDKKKPLDEENSLDKETIRALKETIRALSMPHEDNVMTPLLAVDYLAGEMRNIHKSIFPEAKREHKRPI